MAVSKTPIAGLLTLSKAMQQPKTPPAPQMYNPLPVGPVASKAGYTPTGAMSGATPIYSGPGSTKSPVTGASIGMSAWGKPLTGVLQPSQYGQVLGQNPDITSQIASYLTSRYGEAPEQAVVSLVNKVVNEGMPINEATRMAQGGYGINDPLRVRAADQVSMQFDPQMQQIQQAMDVLNLTQQRNVSQEMNYGREADQRLAGIYSGLNSQLQSGIGQISSLYGGAQQGVGNLYDQAQQTAANATGGVRDRLMASMKQLGLQDAAPSVLPQLESQLAQIQAQNAQSQAGAEGNLQSMGANMGAIASQGAMNAQREGASQRAGLVQQIQNALAQSQGDYMTGITQNLGQLTGLAGQKGAALREAYNTLGEQKYDRTRQTKLDDLASQIQLGTLDLQRQELGMNKDDQAFQHQIQQAQLDMQKQQLQAQLTGNPLDDAKVQAQINEIDSQTALNQSKAAQGGGASSNQAKLDQLMGAAHPGWWGAEGAGPRFRSAVTDLINRAYSQASAPPKFDPLGKRTNPAVDPFTYAMNLAGTSGYDILNPDALRGALKAYFGK